MELLGLFEEIEIAGTHLRPEGFKRSGHLLRIVLEIEHGLVFKEATPLRVKPHHRDVILKLFASFGKDLTQHGGLDEDRWAHVEAEALLYKLRGFSAEP